MNGADWEEDNPHLASEPSETVEQFLLIGPWPGIYTHTKKWLNHIKRLKFNTLNLLFEDKGLCPEILMHDNAILISAQNIFILTT
jgi:hypothetical protein